MENFEILKEILRNLENISGENEEVGWKFWENCGNIQQFTYQQSNIENQAVAHQQFIVHPLYNTLKAASAGCIAENTLYSNALE